MLARTMPALTTQQIVARVAPTGSLRPVADLNSPGHGMDRAQAPQGRLAISTQTPHRRGAGAAGLQAECADHTAGH
jgi:hypothetical protein